ncbi:hypothetical protein [Paenibacillus sp. KS1]|uniref:hypothetical protein n=1 Tax=Paenibacillus sp. KS1 TaxID=1849249 RepID=UPI001585D9B4|nr:hypothetical protein [Paenibacillus sp. KS1]
MGTTLNSMIDFKERMDKLREMIKQVTLDPAEDARSLARALGSDLTIEVTTIE